MSAEGRLVAGRYRLHQQIGSGAMGVVWRAVDERLHRTVAVKQLLLQPGYTDEETEEARQRSMREGRIAARLQHQNAICVFDVAEDSGHPVLVMEYLPSKSLASMLAEQGPLPPLEVARIGIQVAGALNAAHMAGIVHRDLKPGNVLLGDNGTAKITDFGISRAIGDVSVTKSGILAGTPAYLSPEVALGRDPAPASDVFSLGSTLYAAIEGEPPFGVDENAISLLHRVARGEFEPPRQAGPMTPALMQMLRPDPVDRPTMGQAQGLLQAVVDGRPVPSPPTSSWGHGPAAAVAPSKQYDATRVGAPTASNPPTQVRQPAAEPVARRSSPSRAAILWVVALVIAALVGALVANAWGSNDQRKPHAAPTGKQSSAAPSPATPSSAAPSPQAPSQTPKGQPSEQEIEAMVTQYYSLVPHDLDRAWTLLGPSLQSQGKQRYEQFWRSIDDVQIVGQLRRFGPNVLLNLQYTAGGRQMKEQHVLGIVAKDWHPLINTDQRVKGG